jgi:hypothetical protein
MTTRPGQARLDDVRARQPLSVASEAPSELEHPGLEARSRSVSRPGR